MQTVSDIPLFEIVRIYGYRLWELATSLGSTSVMGPENFGAVAQLIPGARRKTITAMRGELGLGGSANLDINPFEGTPLEKKYANADRLNPGPLVL